MKPVDILKYSLKTFRTRKFRTLLTVLGIMIGISTVVALTSLSAGFEIQIQEQIENTFGTNLVTIYSRFNRFGGDSIVFNYSDVDYLESIQHVDLIVPFIQKNVYYEYEGKNISATLIGVDFADYQTIYNNFNAYLGEIPLDTQNSSFVIGYNTYFPDWYVFKDIDDNLKIYYSYNSFEMNLSFNSYETNIVGVLNEIGEFSMSGPSDSNIYLQINKTLELFQNENGTVDGFYMIVDDTSDAVIEYIELEFQSYYGESIRIMIPTTTIDSVTDVWNTITLFLTATAVIALIVAGLGIMNIMYVSVTERTREIGILKAMGSRDSSILASFLIEAAIIGVLGGILGLVVGWIIGAIVGQFLVQVMSGLTASSTAAPGPFGQTTSILEGITAIIPVMNLEIILQALGYSILISIIFGLYPAWRAARMKPVNALRKEF
ncbi:MAG: FtsX-like permease family protein [Candidatus Lokiarchaeota archaeon]|nr:FtsX-like permease family protein [Candidatus Lokiarchaeota archaeon]